MQVDSENRPLIGISSCLLGEQVRYDGGHKQHSYICKTLGDYFDFRSFCPEMAIGLGVPRETIRLVDVEGDIECQATKNPEQNYTQALTDIAEQQHDWCKDLTGYILKKGSPSCGMERVKVYHLSPNGGAHTTHHGVGIFAKALMQQLPYLPIEEEGRLGDAVIRENFISRVLVYQRWRDLDAEGMTLSQLMAFHASLKYTLYSHDQHRTRALGQALAKVKAAEFSAFQQNYLHELMAILTIKATRKNHVNVLQHIQGYLKSYLSSADKQELQDSIQQYHQGMLPLIVPITLMRHYFRVYPNDYISQSSYLYPHPRELMLLNRI